MTGASHRFKMSRPDPQTTRWVAPPPLIRQAIERTRYEIDDPEAVFGRMAHDYRCNTPELRAQAQGRLRVLRLLLDKMSVVR
jgi:hypothetical protein